MRLAFPEPSLANVLAPNASCAAVLEPRPSFAIHEWTEQLVNFVSSEVVKLARTSECAVWCPLWTRTSWTGNWTACIERQAPASATTIARVDSETPLRRLCGFCAKIFADNVCLGGLPKELLWNIVWAIP